MKHKSKTEVLVVGAGPVGMMAALALIRAGVKVQIIDAGERNAVRSYSCGLHPATLSLLAEHGIEAPLQEDGHPIKKIGLYDGAMRKAEIDLTQLPVEFPYVLALPQSALEGILEAELEANGKTRVQWNHRLSDLSASSQGVTATVAKLQTGSTGIIMAEVQQIVASEGEVHADFIVGADGPESFVRRSLKIESEHFGPGDIFALCDFETDSVMGNEVRILLEDDGTEMLWPLTDHMARWSVRTGTADPSAECPNKERVSAFLHASDERRSRFEGWVRTRAPWFVESVKELDWLTEVPFKGRVVERFGQGRCWLAGDSAHETSPIGMQSLNVGLSEAAELAACLKQILHEAASIDLLEDYGRKRHEEWRTLLNPAECISPNLHADEWVRRRSARIIPCLPASGAELGLLAQQLGLDYMPQSASHLAA